MNQLFAGHPMSQPKPSTQIKKIFLIVLLVGFSLSAVIGVGVVRFLSQWNLNAPPAQHQ
ncbi:hypothetical protein K9N68_18170 [Kovacikia minuta CCNUW1]|uniref:hypothetical protein n=1 Tax=Kovacikia minuta TaxID=2931930 RepID=UPI001CCE02CF|nr:hypothetical protein [Kovacikia minuta]UBF23699.1 hypothetical protein K9N68_18170 [Kovacikia minuta CCNUW1]